MTGHYRITIYGRAGEKKTRLLRYHEPDGTGIRSTVQRLDAVLGKIKEPAKQDAVTRITIERIDLAGHVV